MKSLLAAFFVASLALSNGQAPLNITANHDTNFVKAELSLNQTYAGLELEGTKNFTVTADVDGTTVFNLDRISGFDGLVYSDATGYGAEGGFEVDFKKEIGTNETASYDTEFVYYAGGPIFDPEGGFVAFNKTHGSGEGGYGNIRSQDLKIRNGEDFRAYNGIEKSVPDIGFEVAPGKTNYGSFGNGEGERGFKVGDMLEATHEGEYSYDEYYGFNDDRAEIYRKQDGEETKNLRIGDGNGPLYVDATYDTKTLNSEVNIRDLDLLRSFVLSTEAPLLKFIVNQLIDQRRAFALGPVPV